MKPGPPARLRILLVEDEALVAMLMEDMLAGLGHEVVAIAGRLPQALALAADADIDLALLDVNLNGENSRPVAEVLKARGIPVVFATGYGTAGVTNGAPVLQKPFGPADLEAAIARARAPR